ncbi:MAG TPA: hypothetical protein VLX91_13040 [Candidatus Acidoferrales bacterium]|nr:hypothetical protein [Candidatus Acidoferrales bacterium]
MELTDLPEEIQGELRLAQDAMNLGNEGKARVCARRSVGKAFQAFGHAKGLRPGSSGMRVLDANETLKLISVTEEFPAGVREAARRLSASVLEKEISKRPVDDALLIIEELFSNPQ